MSILITLCARGGSKGIPGKNIREIGGKPLIAYSIRHARSFAAKVSADICLSTDDEDIRKVAAGYGLISNYTRPASLASDTAGKVDAIKDILLYEENEKNVHYDYVLDLDVSAPMRTCEDLIQAYNIILNAPEAYNLFSVNKANKNPYFNMVEESADSGYYQLVKKRGDIKSRQTAPAVYDLNASFYFYRRTFFDMGFRTPITERSLIYVIPHICFDLDHLIDFEFLQFLLNNRKLDFEI